MIKNKDQLMSLLVVTLVLLTGLFFRSYPEKNIDRRNEQIARMIVLSRLRQSVTEQVASEESLLETDEKELAEKRFRAALEERHNLERAVEAVLENVDTYKFSLLEADPFYYYSLTKKLIEKGRISNEYQRGKYLNKSMMAPTGHWRHIELHPFTGLVAYKFMYFFNDQTTPMDACVWPTALLAALSAAFFSFWLISLKFSKHIALISGIFFSLSPIFLQRSCAGWYDTDAYNVLFSLLAVIFLKRFLDSEGITKGSVGLAAVCASYALFWEGWIFLTIMVHLVLFTLILRSLKLGRTRKILIKKTALYSLSVFLFAFVLITPWGIIYAFSNVREIISDFLMLSPSVWPNLFLIVGELKSVELGKSFHLLGGHFFVISGILGFFLLALKKINVFDKRTGFSLTCLFLLLFFFSMTAQRFLLFLIVPLSVCFALFYQNAAGLIRAKFSRNFYIAAVGALYLFLSSSFIYAHATARNQFPIYDRVWENALVYIRENTPNEAIVNSWWPPGHFIKAIAERGVTFDGATIQTPRAYWMASALMSEDEKKAAGLLRMLNSSGLEAVEYLEGIKIPLPEAAEIIKELAPLTREEALKEALAILPSEHAYALIALTHSEEAPPGYLLLYKDMVESALGLYFVKNWDLYTAREHAKKQEDLTFFQRITAPLSREDTIAFMWNVSGGRIYISEEIYGHPTPGNEVIFPNGLRVNLERMTARLENLEGKISGTPTSMIFVRHQRVEEKFFGEANVNLSVLLLEHDEDLYSSIIAPREVLNSVLFRLYYLDGLGKERFEKVFSDENPALNNKAEVFEALY